MTDHKSVSAISHDTNQETNEMSSEMTKEQWLAIRKEAGLKIDPETAEVFWNWGQVLDPYGLYDLTDEEKCTQRNYFARSPGSDLRVSFDDLPKAVCDRLWARISAGDFDHDHDLDWLIYEKSSR
jgi:hypothetical protein